MALKPIGQYLKATLDHGLVFNPSRELKTDCYLDADFAGMYGYENSNDPSSVKSRTGLSLLLPTVPSCGTLNCTLRQHFQPWMQRSLPWLIVVKNFFPLWIWFLCWDERVVYQ